MATLPTLYPLNDWGIRATLKDLNLTTAQVEVLIAGTVTCFFSATEGGAAVAGLTVTATYIAAEQYWLIFFDAATLTDTLLEAQFAANAFAWLCVQFVGGFQVWSQVPYARYRLATVV
jgi:hypothetical protein